MGKPRHNDPAATPDLPTCRDLLEQFDPEYNDLVAFAKECGPEALNKLLARLGGLKVHIPRPENFWHGLWRHIRDQDMRARFDGRNYGTLAVEYGISEREARRIIHKPARQYSKSQRRRPIQIPEKLYQEICEIAQRDGVTFGCALGKMMDK